MTHDPVASDLAAHHAWSIALPTKSVDLALVHRSAEAGAELSPHAQGDAWPMQLHTRGLEGSEQGPASRLQSERWPRSLQ